ncbi:maleylpyruvate isomerase family mycothiol-dependent enzyme [Plantibacter sp. VKM Ac-2880]|uniref:maleylpyruvate isomerase family mycothiol-dependent enzyme n=1 Tax=Plantibacter sp. VKM Ac-2880 TaxID=2783827 RepID=UPI0018909426|nr:maleylpyruvate isomerase family mycothiol-dependent enzyme [Plantibacter sp. VKM Ac-2880]MBF4567871.1 maleylpyruvate isomerase family mycothiol-dependent enzyme [Plantibacter sp. VKM Ac-2880]
MTVSPRMVWTVVHAERRKLVADLAGLSEAQWATPSLCAGWDVHDVVAHLVDSAKTTRLGFARRLISARFDFDLDNERGIERERRGRPSETLAALAAAAELSHTPPARLTTRLVEAVVHGEDIRRPLRLRSSYPTTAVVQALEYQLRTRVSMGGGKERWQGVRLVADDTSMSWGGGPEVRGSALDLLLAVSGRPTGVTLPGF